MKMVLILGIGTFLSFFDGFYFYFWFIFFSLCSLLEHNFFGQLFFFDSLSFFLVFLTTIVFVFCWFSDLSVKWLNSGYLSYMFFLFFIFFFSFLSFLSWNMLFFYLSFEMIFMVMFVFLVSWGYSPERFQASFYMVFYTLVVSFPFFIYVIFFGSDLMTFNFSMFKSSNEYWWILLILVFLVKLPVYSFHLWLPKAHVEAPVSGSMVLAGVLLKLGFYGIYRFIWWVGSNIVTYGGYLVSMGLLGGVFSCFVCLRQVDLKSFVAYSSVCHMGIGICGIFCLSFLGYSGSIMMMISHGFCSSCLFYLLYVIYKRFFSRSIFVLKGMFCFFPFLSFVWFFFSVLNLSVPPSLAFFSEIYLISVLLCYNFFTVAVVFFFLFLCGLYCIYFFISVNHGGIVLDSKSFFIFVREILVFYGHLFFLFFLVLVLSFFL